MSQSSEFHCFQVRSEQLRPHPGNQVDVIEPKFEKVKNDAALQHQGEHLIKLKRANELL